MLDRHFWYFFAFVYGYPSSCPRAQCTLSKSVTTLRYTRRHGPVYTGRACRHLPSAVSWISEECILRSALVAEQWRGDTALTFPLFWRRPTVSPVFFGRYPRSSLHSFVLFPPPHPRPPPPNKPPLFCGRKAKWSRSRNNKWFFFSTWIMNMTWISRWIIFEVLSMITHFKTPAVKTKPKFSPPPPPPLFSRFHQTLQFVRRVIY